MKRSKRLIVLAAILVVACIATFALSQYEERQEQIKSSDAIILRIPSDSVQSLSWEYPESSLGFHKGDAGWLYDDDEAFPVSEEKVMDILSRFEAFGVAFMIENVTDYSQYGLDKPECTIHLATAEQSYDIRLGSFSKMDEQRYIDIGDGNVYLVSEDPVDYISASLSGMVLHDDTPDFETVADIQFAGSENYTVVRTEDSSDTYQPEDIYFTQRNGKTVPLDTAKVSQYLNTIASVELVEYVTYNATAQELESFGLDTPELSVTVSYTNTDDSGQAAAGTCVLHISRNPEELAAAEKAEAAGETPDAVTKYVRVGDSQIVYQLNDADYAILAAAGYNDLRHAEVIWADFEVVTQIDITLEGKDHTFTRSEEEPAAEDAERIWYYNEQQISISALRSALEALSADSFTDEAPTQIEEISLTVHLDNENFPQVKIQLYRYNGSFCLAVVDGESVSLVARSAAIDLVEAVQAIVLN